jgi:hypothetical protein
LTLDHHVKECNITEMRYDGRNEARGDGAVRNRGGEVRGQLRVRVPDDQGDDGQAVRSILAHRRRRGLRLRDNLPAQTPPLHVLCGQPRHLHMEVRVSGIT